MILSLSNYIKSYDCFFKISFDQAKNRATEMWETDSHTTFSIEENGFELEIIYDKNMHKNEKLMCYSVSKGLIQELITFFDSFLYAFEGDEEIVIFLKDGVNIHLQKQAEKSISWLKVIPGSTIASRELIKKMLPEISLIQLKSSLNSLS